MPPNNERAWHYVKPNETTRVPRRLVILDCEAFIDPIDGGHAQRWACGVARMVSTRPDRARIDRWRCYDDPVAMWKEIGDWAGTSGRTVLYTHNLAYDTRISEALSVLPELGWSLIAHNLVRHGTWLIWRKDRATLHMCDSASIFPTTLAKLAQVMGMSKLPLPGSGQGGIGLYSRCWRDVEILSRAILEYLEWIETADLGNWQATGAGQAWATYRHKFMDRRLLVHDDDVALKAERRAMWAGRCEAYWHGEIQFQVVHEWDLELAYGTIARDTPIPVRLLGPMPEGFDGFSVLHSQSTALLAEVEIVTEVPVVPTELEGRIVWPTGRFASTLWDVEILAAVEAGAQVTIRRGWLYRKAPALSKWALWCIDQVRAGQESAGDWRAIVTKHWLRALIGRMAMTYTEWEPYATAPHSDAISYPLYDATTGETTTMVQVGRDIWQDVGVREWSQSMPMVTGYVQAVARVRYWTILREAPPQSVLYGDTDSVLVTDRHLAAMADVARAHPEWGLRLKRSWQGFAVWGPRQIRTGAAVRISGVPRTAVRTGPQQFEGEVWETLPGALARGHAQQVVTKDRTWRIRGIDRRRIGPDIGWTHPIMIGGEHDQQAA